MVSVIHGFQWYWVGGEFKCWWCWLGVVDRWLWWFVGFKVFDIDFCLNGFRFWLMGFNFDFDFDYVVDDGWLGLGAEKMWKFCRKIAFSECYQTPKIIFWTIFHYITKYLDFIFVTGKQFPLKSFYARNWLSIEPNAPLATY